MNIAVGKITERARAAIENVGGSIEGTLKPSVWMVVLPDGTEELSSDALGCHVGLPAPSEIVLVFSRAWHTEDCSLDLCQS
jgi:hypothetical protein